MGNYGKFSGRFNPRVLGTIGIIILILGILSGAVFIYNSFRMDNLYPANIYVALVGILIIFLSLIIKFLFDALEEIIISLRNIEISTEKDKSDEN